MKKILFTIAMVAVGFTATAQENAKGGFEKQDWYVSGTAGYNNISVEGIDSDVSSFTFSPSVGYFVSDNIALEMGLILGESTTEFFGDTIEASQFGVTLAGNYFFTPQSDFSFVVGAGLSYISTGNEINGNEQPDSSTFAIAVAPGVNYFISERLALRALVGALSYSSTSADGSSSSTNTFGLNLNLSDVNFGLTYKF
ncbi:conserved exported hypothetical protein [Tenacibaculum sediminilitoris]|uniref:outer membrane beta-barrel protein n=1 Tax=Tenacibaculum sediminilitoris TaxID=1820334 RepID=UPI00389502F2